MSELDDCKRRVAELEQELRYIRNERDIFEIASVGFQDHLDRMGVLLDVWEERYERE